MRSFTGSAKHLVLAVPPDEPVELVEEQLVPGQDGLDLHVRQVGPDRLADTPEIEGLDLLVEGPGQACEQERLPVAANFLMPLAPNTSFSV